MMEIETSPFDMDIVSCSESTKGARLGLIIVQGLLLSQVHIPGAGPDLTHWVQSMLALVSL